ncbi:Cu-binding protein [Rhodotorula mucilaginosa]|uniref:Cu-binding protein n=1 Tax=Rhodotorula mucilaginosa TaxID=5537 RepID=A0A9P6W404_RHOMI|nr:Cu-binding protein [Rhodotorula mucilaginosa]
MLARSLIAPLRAAARPAFAAPSRAFSASRLALDTSSSPKPSAPSTGPVNDASTANAAPSSSSTQQNRTQAGPFTLKAGAVFVATGVGLWYYFQSEKEKVRERKRMETAAARVGRPKIGGPFLLTDQDGKPFSDKDLLGKWSMVYFGFTNCPDICPEELDKMTVVVEGVSASHKVDILPVFITCDPARDDVNAVKTYVKDFHPSLVGLTGSYDDVKKTCKAYRVYFSTPPNTKPGDDYLVDHSIFFYLMDPNGKFVDAFGRSMGAENVTNKVRGYLDEWKEFGGKGSWTEAPAA